MPDTPIERIARAGYTRHWPEHPWNVQSDRVKQEWIKTARAIIAAAVKELDR